MNKNAKNKRNTHIKYYLPYTKPSAFYSYCFDDKCTELFY
jgi:hypothetical protein